MELHLPTILLLLLLSSSFFIIFFISPAVSLPPTTTAGDALPPTYGGALPPTSDDTDYLRTSCQTTRYPETCFTTLVNYSGDIHRDGGRLAMVAIHVALHNATQMVEYVANISRQEEYSGSTTESAAVRDCVSVIGDAVYEIHKSNRQMRRLGWTGESLRFELSNVQTWMSAALTNEDTCVDGFDEVADDGGVKAEVCGRVVAVKMVTSNALALVNRYADSVSV